MNQNKLAKFDIIGIFFQQKSIELSFFGVAQNLNTVLLFKGKNLEHGNVSGD